MFQKWKLIRKVIGDPKKIWYKHKFGNAFRFGIDFGIILFFIKILYCINFKFLIVKIERGNDFYKFCNIINIIKSIIKVAGCFSTI